MITEMGTNAGSFDSAAFTLALAVLLDRIRGLPKDDRNDLYELAKVLFAADTEDERQSAAMAMREILEQQPIKVSTLEPMQRPGGDLKKWISYISRKIAESRKAAGLSQKELATKTGIPQSHISRLESGKHSPSSVTVEKIAAALGVDAEQLDPSA